MKKEIKITDFEHFDDLIQCPSDYNALHVKFNQMLLHHKSDEEIVAFLDNELDKLGGKYEGLLRELSESGLWDIHLDQVASFTGKEVE